MGQGWRERSGKKGWRVQWQEAPGGLTEQGEPSQGLEERRGKQEAMRMVAGMEWGGRRWVWMGTLKGQLKGLADELLA